MILLQVNRISCIKNNDTDWLKLWSAVIVQKWSLKQKVILTDGVISWVLQSSRFYHNHPPRGAQNVLASLQYSLRLISTLIEKTFTASVTCCAVQVWVFLKLFSSLPDEILILLFFAFLQRKSRVFVLFFQRRLEFHQYFAVNSVPWYVYL